MSNAIVRAYISDQLSQLYFGRKCCNKFLWCLYQDDTENFMKMVKQLKLNVRPCLYNKQDAVIVYRVNCFHIIEDVLTLQLAGPSTEKMYSLHSSIRFIGSASEMHVSSDFLKASDSMPLITPHRFSFPYEESIAHLNMAGYNRYQEVYPIQSYKAKILDGLQRNRVLLVSDGANLDKSGAIPLCIMEQLLGSKRLCKIICVEREQIIAMYNSERMAEYFNEPIGNTIAYQVHLHNCMSDTSSLIYTTAPFFLRILMGQSIMKCFALISHVIVADVHLHQAYTDILLRQLKEALKYRIDLKVILLSNYPGNQYFLQYFGEGEELNLHEINIGHTSNGFLRPPQSDYPKIFYYDDIQRMVQDKCPSKEATDAFQYFSTVKKHTINTACLDRCLERYDQSAGSQKSFDHILYMVYGEGASINYRHSFTGRTAIILASIYGKINHIKILLQLNADPTILDKQNINAFKAAQLSNHFQCADLMNASFFGDTTQWRERNNNIKCINYYGIVDIIHMITTDLDTWKPGDIIVFLPSYEHLIRLNYYIAKQKILGNIPEKLMVYLLHNDSEKYDLDAILKGSSKLLKCILVTELAESLYCFANIRYIIDTVRRRKIVYNDQGQCKEYAYDWTPKRNMEKRLLLLQSEGETYCFRLISSSFYGSLPEMEIPELLTIPLERVCLTAKLLAPHNLIAEFLDEVIVKPPLMQIYHCIEHLKKLNVLSDSEELTWWGCRLIDIPIDLQCGKVLILSVLLQCLDPILTIVCFMSMYDPLELSIYLDNLTEPFKDNLRLKIKREYRFLADNYPSDHITYLYLYQEWQNMARDNTTALLMDEQRYMLDGLLEYISVKRAQLIGSLRLSQLLHSKGHFSMPVVNQKSNCWPIIKAVLAGGLYPNICYYDFKTNLLKASSKRELVLHPNTVLRECELNICHKNVWNFNSPWILYGNETFSWNSNSISSCTVVSPIAVALFAGNVRMSTSNIQCTEELIPYSETEQVTFVVDEWITFTMKHNDAQLLLRTRQLFYNSCSSFLKHCGVKENTYFGKIRTIRNDLLFNCIEALLAQEDAACNFRQPTRIGLRPKAMPQKPIENINRETTSISFRKRKTYAVIPVEIGMNWSKPPNIIIKDKQFFLVHQNIIYHNEIRSNLISNIKLNHQETSYKCCHLVPGIINGGTNNNYNRSNSNATTIKGISKASLIYIIKYRRNPDKLLSVALVDWEDNGQIHFKDCFRTEINLYDIWSIMCLHDMLPLAIQQTFPVIPLNREVGELIINLFAFRHHWLHNC